MEIYRGKKYMEIYRIYRNILWKFNLKKNIKKI